ncbi:hypothetical protein [Kitasatospora sp. CB02891]|uniref:hypothetical protein n=1 Tax=Kitasatospora sp. CB02891 TaxID=2020329 RepID=UPI000C275E70|nr:hypothetical protein [Kitasatospora sp. CB02891]PJN21156.1 hypothetical protein CG736_35030 [Kitasatospora sp. CB02891]
MRHYPHPDPAVLLAERGYGLMTQQLPVSPGALTRLVTWAAANPSRIWPGVTGTVGFGLARWLHADGGTDVTNIVTLGLLAAATAAAGLVSASKQHGDSMLTATAFGVSGALAVFTVAGATSSVPLALAMVLAPTVLAYVLAALGWRKDRRSREEHRHQMDMERLRTYRELQLAELGNQQVRDAGMYALALAEALRHRTGMDATDSQITVGNTGSTTRSLSAPPAREQYAELLTSCILQPTADQLTAWTAAKHTR